MASIAVYPPDATNPEIVYLHRDPYTRASIQDLSSMTSLTSTMSVNVPPPVPRKSSRRNLRASVLSIQTPTAPTAPVEIQSSPVELPSESESAFESADEALERAIEELENAQLSDSAPPSYTASPTTSPTHSDSSLRFSQLSSASSEVPPEYQLESPRGHPADPANSFTMTADEKALLRASLPDDEADSRSLRSESVYSLPQVEPIPEHSSAAASSSPSDPERKILHIKQKGMNTLRFPLPSNELQVHITNANGSVAYISTRAKRSSSNCVLYQPDVGSVIQTHYDKHTTLTSLQDDGPALEPFVISGKGIKRQQSFALPDGQGHEFEWKYLANRGAYGRREERLVLVQKGEPLPGTPARSESFRSSFSGEEKVAVAAQLDKAKRLFPAKGKCCQRPATLSKSRCHSSSGMLAAAKATNKKGKSPLAPAPRILAQLIRPEHTSRAGNGGELVLEPGCTDLVPEEVVVATGLVMLKREMDRLRALQAGVIVTILL